MLKGNKSSEKNDLALVTNYYESGDSMYLGQLFESYTHLVYGLCLKYLKTREDSQDATMEIFEKVAKELRKTEVEHFKSWLYILSRNHCFSILRKKNNLTETELYTEKNYSDFMEYESFFTLIDKDDFEKNSESELIQCLEKLNPVQNQCIKLFYYKEKCYNEIAEALQVTVKKVKSYLQNGKRNLKQCLELSGQTE